MTPEELCVERELAEKMAKLGWPQGISWYGWVFLYEGNGETTWQKWKLLETKAISYVKDIPGVVYFDAPTMGEILKDLSHEIRIYPDRMFNSIEGFWFEGSLRKYHIEYSPTSLANSLGLYWCWWKKKNRES